MIAPIGNSYIPSYRSDVFQRDERDLSGRSAKEGGTLQPGDILQDPSTAAMPPVAQANQGDAKKSGKRDSEGRFDQYECQTCKSRKYQDGSDDPGVSFKTPTSLSPEEAAAAVRSHEQEHVTREQAEARREGSEVVSQSVSYRTGMCPECGQTYVAGGTTRTVTRQQVNQAYGLEQEERGRFLNLTA